MGEKEQFFAELARYKEALRVDASFDVVSLTVCMWGIALPCAFSGAFYFHWPVLVIYACTCLDEVGKIPWVLIHHRSYKWVRNLTRD